MTSPASRAAQQAEAWARRYPKLRGALARALALVGGVEPVKGRSNAYTVDGEGDSYFVEIDRTRGTSRCACKAWRFCRGPRPRCKHTLAVALLESVGAAERRAA